MKKSIPFYALLFLVFLPLAGFCQLNSNALNGDNMALKYLVKEPKIMNQKTPVIILLHGTGSNEKDLFNLSEKLPQDALIISARAPITLAQNSYTWYHIDFKTGAPSINNGEAEASRKLILQFIDQVIKKYNADPHHVYLMGFSQGAIMSYSIALTKPEKVRGILALSGRILDESKKMTVGRDKFKNLSVFIAHGTNDKVLPITYAKDAIAYIKKQKIKNAYHEYPMQHEISIAELNDIQAWFGQDLATNK